VRHLGFDALTARRQPRSGAILVLVQVSSMNTSRLGSDPIPILAPLRRRRATSGTILLGGNQRLFFVTEFLSVEELHIVR